MSIRSRGKRVDSGVVEQPVAEFVEMIGHFLNERRVELIERIAG